MPYTYKKQDNKYCVYKKDTGEKVGCTGNTRAELKKYLAALHINEILAEVYADSGLGKWFGKGKSGGVGGGGWDRYDAQGNRIGKCGDAEKGDAYSACLSKEKAQKLGKDGRAKFVRRKRDAQNKAGDSKKGGEHKKGQSPTKVKTENFADGKNPGRKGLSKRFGISQKMPISQLEKIAKSSSGEKQKMAQWNLNMKRGRIKTEAVVGNKIVCDNCSWSWNIKDGGDDLFLCHKCDHDNTPVGINTINKEMKMSSKDNHGQKLKENLDPKTFKDTGKSSPYGSGYRALEERLNLFLERNVPNDPGKWSYATSQAKKKYDVYPSAYANAWASKKYKELGGTWRKAKK